MTYDATIEKLADMLKNNVRGLLYIAEEFDAWLGGSPIFVPVYQLLNRLCRAGALAPGTYAVTGRA